MRETRADTAQALLFALLLHVLLFGLAFFGLWWTKPSTPVSAAGSPVQADVVDPAALSASMRRALQAPPKPSPVPVEAATPPPQPVPEPAPQESPVPRQRQAQEAVPVPDRIEQERVDRDALSADTRAREQQAKHRQEQIDLTEQQRQQRAEQQEHLAQQQLADIRRQRAEAAKDAQRAEQKLQQLADAQARRAARADATSDASPPPGNDGNNADLRARYAAALQQAILQNWRRPDSVPLGQRCKLNIRQLPGGTVVDVQVAGSCPYDEAGKRSVEAAVLMAQPLPYAGFEPVFSRNITVNFEAQEN